MKAQNFLIAIQIIFISTISQGAWQTPSLPQHWSFHEGISNSYRAGLSKDIFHSGNSSIYIEGAKGSLDLGSITQVISAEKYKGKKIALSAYVKTQDTHYASIWLRTDGKCGKVLAFANMDKHRIRGSNDWKSYSVELEIPKDGDKIILGAFLSGNGKVWVDDFAIQTIGVVKDALIKDEKCDKPSAPVKISDLTNPGFED